jgi:hypothetical protein
MTELINTDKHLHINGLTEIISLRTCLNKGLSDKFKTLFPRVIKMEKPILNVTTNINYN